MQDFASKFSRIVGVGVVWYVLRFVVIAVVVHVEIRIVFPFVFFLVMVFVFFLVIVFVIARLLAARL